MSRNKITEAVVLSLTSQGENNKTVRIFTPEGIVFATLFGGAKSKMRGLVSPFNRGKMYLYHDAAKKLTKISDFDVTSFHQTFRENLFKSWAATLASEIVIKSKCAGSPSECWVLFNGFLDGLDFYDEKNGKLGLIRFLWRYILLLGVAPSTKECGICSKPFFTRNFEKNKILFSYSLNENSFLCESCSAFKDNLHCIQLSSEALFYIDSICEKSASEVRALKITSDAVNELKRLLFYLIEIALGQKLNSLEIGVV